MKNNKKETKKVGAMEKACNPKHILFAANTTKNQQKANMTTEGYAGKNNETPD